MPSSRVAATLAAPAITAPDDSPAKMPRSARRRFHSIERRLGPLAHPVTFILVWFFLLYLWHVPAMYEAAIRNPFVHAIEHASFFVAGCAVWWPLIQPVPMRYKLKGVAIFGYILAAKLGLGMLGLYLTWSDTVE